MFYSAAYAAMNVGAFAVITQMAGSGERFVQIDDYSGLGKRAPLLAAALAAALTFFLLSLIGIPITGGFFAKFYVFSAALRTHLIWLTIIGLVNSGMGSYYYLRLIVRMYMFEPQTDAPLQPVRLGMKLAIAISLIVTLWLGVLPNEVLHYTQGVPTILAGR
jgi:NADH-quinone oxidoreductase subunit N